MLLFTLPGGSLAQDAGDVLSRIEPRDRSWITSQPDAWLTQKLIELNTCRDGSPTLTRAGAAAWRQATEDRDTQRRIAVLLDRLAPFDADGDGQITGAEASAPNARLASIIRGYDRNADGEISDDEVAHKARVQVRNEEIILGLCDRLLQLDMNGDGAVDRRDLEAAAAAVASK